jgi:hypothetical protein
MLKKLKPTTFDWLLLGIIVAVFLFVGCLFTTFLKVQQAKPLENIKAWTVEPIYEDSFELVWEGHYDRDIPCKLYDYKLFFTNIATNDILVVGKDHLTREPSMNIAPGKNIPINFAIKKPSGMYQGKWKTMFEGYYMCKKGIFMSEVHVYEPVNPFTVLPAKEK